MHCIESGPDRLRTDDSTALMACYRLWCQQPRQIALLYQQWIEEAGLPSARQILHGIGLTLCAELLQLAPGQQPDAYCAVLDGLSRCRGLQSAERVFLHWVQPAFCLNERQTVELLLALLTDPAVARSYVPVGADWQCLLRVLHWLPAGLFAVDGGRERLRYWLQQQAAQASTPGGGGRC